MRRIILVVGLALLMATFVMVSALPAIAAPPDKVVRCSDGRADITDNAEGFRDQGRFKGEFSSGGNRVTQEVTPNPGPGNPGPPGNGEPPLPPI
jgi:hypothetical protein